MADLTMPWCIKYYRSLLIAFQFKQTIQLSKPQTESSDGGGGWRPLSNSFLDQFQVSAIIRITDCQVLAI